jgi:Mg2+ and Co2+ transporter CorA
MITIYRGTEAGLKTVERPTKECWIDVTNPTQDEARNLVRDLGIPQEFVNYSLNPDKIPLVERSKSFTSRGKTGKSAAGVRLRTDFTEKRRLG